MSVVVIKRKKYKFTDLTVRDIKLLNKSYNLEKTEFMCFGESYGKLSQLNLITEDCRISYYGRKLVQHLNFEV